MNAPVPQAKRLQVSQMTHSLPSIGIAISLLGGHGVPAHALGTPAHGDQTIVLRPVRRIVMRARPRVRIVLAVHRNGTARTPANTLVRPAHGNEMITLRHIRRIEMLTRVMVIQTIHRHRRARRRPDRNRHARQRNQREHRRHTRGPPPSIPLHDTGTPPRNRKGRTRPERRARPNGKERGRNYLADTAYQPTPSARQPTETRRSFSDPSAV